MYNRLRRYANSHGNMAYCAVTLEAFVKWYALYKSTFYLLN